MARPPSLLGQNTDNVVVVPSSNTGALQSTAAEIRPSPITPSTIHESSKKSTIREMSHQGEGLHRCGIIISAMDWMMHWALSDLGPGDHSFVFFLWPLVVT